MIYVFMVLLNIVIAGFCFSLFTNFNNLKNTYLSFFLILCIVIMGGRSTSVGADTYNYSHYYEIICNSNLSEIIAGGWYYNSIEIGYCLFMKACSLFSKNYYFFQIIYAILFNILFGKFLRNNNNNYFLASAIYFGGGIYLLAFNIARQMLAAIIVANTWAEIRKKRYIYVILNMVVACSIHSTAIIFLIAFIFYLCKDKPKILRVLLVSGIVLAVNYQSFIVIVSHYLTKYGNYYGNNRNIMSAGGARIVWGIILICALFLMLNSEENGEIDSSDGMLMGEVVFSHGELMVLSIFSFIYVVSNVIGLTFNLFERVGCYFQIFLLPMYECCGEKIREINTRKVFFICLWIAYTLLFLYGTLGPHASGKYKYSFFVDVWRK